MSGASRQRGGCQLFGWTSQAHDSLAAIVPLRSRRGDEAESRYGARIRLVIGYKLFGRFVNLPWRTANNSPKN